MVDKIKEVAAHRPKFAATPHRKVQRDCISCTKVYHYRKDLRKTRAELGLMMLICIALFVAFAVAGLQYQLADARANRLEQKLKQAVAVSAQATPIPDYTNNDEAIAALEYVWANDLSACAEYTEVGR